MIPKGKNDLLARSFAWKTGRLDQEVYRGIFGIAVSPISLRPSS